MLRGKVFYIVCLLASMLLCAYFFHYVEVRSLNAPYRDDIRDILKFLLRFESAEGLWNSLLLLHEQHNDHRTTASRLVYLAAFQSAGEIDFRMLALLANSSLLILLAGYASQLGKGQNFPTVLLIVCLLLMHPRAFTLLSYPMAAFAFYFLYGYSFLAILLLHRTSTWSFSAALVCALVANFSIASGQLTWLFGLMLLMYRYWTNIDRNPYKPVIWLLASVAALSLFHVGLETQHDIVTLMLKFLETPLRQMHFFLVMMGSVVAFESLAISTVLGAVFLGLLCLLTLRDWSQGLNSLHWFAWFIVASLIVLMLGRALYFPVEFALKPRYSFASMNLLVCLFLLTLKHPSASKRWHLGTALVLATVVCVGSYTAYTPVYDDHNQRRIREFNADSYWMFGFPRKEANAIVRQAIDRGIYFPPAKPVKQSEQ